MLLGGTAYVDLYPQLKEGVLIWRIYEKIIPPQLFGVNPWRMVLAMIVLALVREERVVSSGLRGLVTMERDSRS
ncbi:hypothetical protein A7E78_10725 [Syntrophotalea acetylenivorans]|uniref:Uncharacterized protein n=1 Tax=Syntrophotalea acetylenivorans TaxID=1842532 RepID=A0A1L3GRJ5_9BACT|nr:hypothetical protein A7E78_10725 [Syntrophotalea acetylenivorans]